MLKQLADELVQMTSALVSGRIINVMDQDGIIIASTEFERIGTVHEGARRVLKTGETVKITKKQLPLYPGAKEGCNMPIHMNGKIIGVVGIYGNPEEIQDLAKLLEVYAEKYFELETIIYQRMQENELRYRLMRRLISEHRSERSQIQAHMDDLQLKMMPAFQAAIISPISDDSSNMRDVLMKLIKDKVLSFKRDLYCTDEKHIYIIKSNCEQEKNCWEQIQSIIQNSGEYKLSLGSCCDNFEQIRGSYLEAYSLDRTSSGRFNNISDPAMRCLYEMDVTVRRHESYFREKYETLKRNMKSDDLEILLTSAECYYEEEHSITRAAAKLFIHKNTLQYRIQRLLEMLELSGQPIFCQEYLVRLILHYHKNH